MHEGLNTILVLCQNVVLLWQNGIKPLVNLSRITIFHATCWTEQGLLICFESMFWFNRIKIWNGFLSGGTLRLETFECSLNLLPVEGRATPLWNSLHTNGSSQQLIHDDHQMNQYKWSSDFTLNERTESENVLEWQHADQKVTTHHRLWWCAKDDTFVCVVLIKTDFPR